MPLFHSTDKEWFLDLRIVLFSINWRMSIGMTRNCFSISSNIPANQMMMPLLTSRYETSLKCEIPLLTLDSCFAKQIEKKLSAKHPDKWTPLYEMVTFSEMRYSEALSRGKEQDKIMEEILSWEGIEDNWESPDVFEKIEKKALG